MGHGQTLMYRFFGRKPGEHPAALPMSLDSIEECI